MSAAVIDFPSPSVLEIVERQAAMGPDEAATWLVERINFGTADSRLDAAAALAGILRMARIALGELSAAEPAGDAATILAEADRLPPQRACRHVYHALLHNTPAGRDAFFAALGGREAQRRGALAA